MSSGRQFLVLSDDEATAVAARTHQVWHSALATVDQGDLGGLTAAMRRGLRSLARRGLLQATPEGAVFDERVNLVAGALPGGPCALAYVAAASAPLALAGAEVVGYSVGDGDVLVELVRGLGSHDFAVLERDEFVDFLTRVIGAEVRRRPDDGGPRAGFRLHVCRTIDVGSEVLVASPGVVGVGHVTEAGGVELSDRTVDPRAFVAGLLPPL